MHLFFHVWKRLSKMDFFTVAFLSVALILFGTISITLVEPETFPTLFDGLWWTMTTVTTVGYGDFYPTTILGRIIGMFLFIFGIGLIGLFLSKIIDGISHYNRLKMEGKLLYKKSNHYIFIGWTSKTENTLKEVLHHNPQANIVIIDQLNQTPTELDNVHFIQGDPSLEETLLKANILQSKRVSIFADESIKHTLLNDGRTLLIASAVEALSRQHNANIHTVVEICEEHHISKFEHIQIDDFILSNDSVSMLMARATLHPKSTSLFRQLLSKRFGSNIYEIKAKADWKTYEDAYLQLYNKGATLIAVNEEMNLAQLKSHALQPTDTLFIICNEETYNNI